MEQLKKKSIYENPKNIIWLALIATFSWGCAVPLIKLGMNEFMITSENVGGKVLFAGIRFSIAGLLVLLFAWKKKRPMKVAGKEMVSWIVLFALVNTTFHYFFFYIGLSNTLGSRGTIIDSMGTFLLVLIACVVFPEDKLSLKKIVGCLLGFLGIWCINKNGGQGGHFTIAGDGMLILNAVCAAVGGILTRIVTRKIDALAVTGYSLFMGGLFLLLGGKMMGGSLPVITGMGIIILLFLILISAVSFTIYNQLLCHHPVGKIAIFNCFVPIFGILLSCLLLKEPFQVNYCVAGLLVAAGVYTVNKK